MLYAHEHALARSASVRLEKAGCGNRQRYHQCDQGVARHEQLMATRFKRAPAAR